MESGSGIKSGLVLSPLRVQASVLGSSSHSLTLPLPGISPKAFYLIFSISVLDLPSPPLMDSLPALPGPF